MVFFLKSLNLGNLKMTQKLLFAIPAALSLAACGGGGDDVTNVPARAQYSYTTSAPNWTTKLPANLSTYAERDGTNVTSSQKVVNVEYKQWNSTRAAHDQVDVQINGDVITLTWDATEQAHVGTYNGRTYVYNAIPITDNDPTAPETAAEVFDIISIDLTNPNSIATEGAMGVIGFETPDSVVAAATGTANYTGRGNMVFMSASAVDVAEMQANFAVNFTNSTISGAVDIDDPRTGPLTYNFATVNVPQTALTGNGFSAQPTVTVNNPGGNTYTFNNETINGTFYGDNSEVLAGVLSADYTENGAPGVALGTYWGH
jgi:hypothetical protein